MEPSAPFDGDRSWKALHTLTSGAEITIRGIVPEDREELRRAFRETSPQTRYLRFFGAAAELTEAMLTYLTCVDQQHHVALVATLSSPDLKTERGVGVARFIRLDDGDVAEAAITVADDMQRRGVAKALAYELERAAVARGVRVLRAEVLENNTRMRSILEGAGARPAAAPEDGMISYDIDLGAGPVSVAPSLVDILRGAAETMAMTIRRLRAD
ncbi:MAG: GNAT family N-acetyltransferase [Labilithrix sp.]|nr:GNAT family N-acetyltransferase [Labilithrix sp.]